MSDYVALLDWGTSNFRAYLLTESGAVEDSVASEQGVAKLDKAGMASLIEKLHAKWRDYLPVYYACGMVGSSIGWLEAPYVQAPADIKRLSDHLLVTEIGGIALHIVPGVSCLHANGDWDVMRGEELQALGWLLTNASLDGNAVCLLPGTHSKWVSLKQGSIAHFFTAMTGELYALIKEHGLLKHHLTEAVVVGEAFLRGVARGAGEVAITSQLFSIRANSLLAGLSNKDASAFASGLLIGSEIADGVRRFEGIGEVSVVGSSSLNQLYVEALKSLGVNANAVESHSATISGFKAVHTYRTSNEC